MIDNGSGPDFREFVIFYHEIGDEAFRPLNKKGDFLPQRDPLTDAYRPGGRAINYRSEPFGIDQMHLQHEYFGFEDESLAYSAYTFGDPPTTIPRAYLGDPVKWRIVHGGSEVFHSHHPHSGSIRWQRSPRADRQEHWCYGQGWAGEVSGRPNEVRPRGRGSDRSVRSVGSRDRNADPVGCQHLAGEFLFHCHVAHHYVAGMWGYARFYNTLQVGGATPTRCRICVSCRIGRAGSSSACRPTSWSGRRSTGSERRSRLSTRARRPTGSPIRRRQYQRLGRNVVARRMGKPGHTDDEKGQIMAYDATVWDWKWDGNMAHGERESTATESEVSCGRQVG